MTCEAGTYSAESAQNCSSCHDLANSPRGSSKADCLCNEGYAGDGVSNCYECDWSMACPCKANYYGDPRNYGGCTRCPDKSYSPEGSLSGWDCVCEAGYYRQEEFDFGSYTYTYTCAACPANSMSVEGSVSEYDCRCLAGEGTGHACRVNACNLPNLDARSHMLNDDVIVCRFLRELGLLGEDLRGLPSTKHISSWPGICCI